MNIIFFFTLLASVLLAQEELPASLTPEEMQHLNDIGILRELTPPPQGEFRLVAEYDQADGVLFSWSNSYSNLIGDLITSVSLLDTAWVIVPNVSTQTSVNSLLAGKGADLSRVQYMLHGLNSVWIRDYGPWWGLDENGNRGVVDFIYNRPRPLDDAFPQYLAAAWELPYYGPDLIHPGGNFIVDGHGRAFLTTLVQNENGGKSMAEINAIFRDYAGLDTVFYLTPMESDGTGHIDMFCKLLNDSTFIVGEYASAEDGAGNNFNILNQNAQFLAQLTSAVGTPYHVERIPMPPYNGSITYTYTNSLIVNELVLVPIYGFDTDSDALDLYANLMPGFTIQGFDSNIIIPANGAIHCITKLVMSETPEDCVIGDLNNDVQQNIQDLILLVQLLLGDLESTPGLTCAGDLNSDQAVNIQDVILLVNTILGVQSEG